MSSSEKINHTQTGQQESLRSWSEKDWLDSLTLEELLTNITEQWEHCDRGFNDLFDELNKTSVQPVDMFDIRMESKQVGTAVVDTYMRLWREGDAHNIQRLVLANGKMIDRSETETFDKWTQYELLKSMRQRITEGGNDVDENVYLHDLRYNIYPSAVKTTDTLADLWDKVKEPPLNPQFAHLFPWLKK